MCLLSSGSSKHAAQITIPAIQLMGRLREVAEIPLSEPTVIHVPRSLEQPLLRPYLARLTRGTKDLTPEMDSCVEIFLRDRGRTAVQVRAPLLSTIRYKTSYIDPITGEATKLYVHARHPVTTLGFVNSKDVWNVFRVSYDVAKAPLVNIRKMLSVS